MRQQIQSWLVPIDPADVAPGAVTLTYVGQLPKEKCDEQTMKRCFSSPLSQSVQWRAGPAAGIDHVANCPACCLDVLVAVG